MNLVDLESLFYDSVLPNHGNELVISNENERIQVQLLKSVETVRH